MIKNTTQKGFSLVETLVAITILLVTIMGPLYAFQQSILSHYIARDKLIATALAQDGMEYVRNIRDNNYLTSQPWLTKVSACTGASLCNVDSVSDTVAVCPSAVCSPLTLNSKKQYSHNSSSPYTKFYRTVNLTNTANPNEVQVLVKVEWKNSVGTSTVNVIGELYNWQ